MKKNRILFPIGFAIYIVAGIAAIFLFYNNGSSDAQSASVEIVDEVSAASDSGEPAQPEASSEPAATDSQPDPTSGSAIADEQPEASSEPAITDNQPEEISEPDETNDSPDTEPDEEEDDDKIYYAFEVIDRVRSLRVHETSKADSPIVGRIKTGDKGYVLKKGKTYTKIVTEDGSVIGYVSNDYITISEIPKKDYPLEYR